MCDNPKVAIILKSEYDVSFMLTGKRSKPQFVGRLSDYAKDVVNSTSTAYDISTHFPPEYDILFIPCRKCFSCRLDHSRRRAGQAYCEYVTSEKACFLTLTFGDNETYNYFRTRKYNKLSPYLAKRKRDFLSWSLDGETFSCFMKRVRDHVRQIDMRKFCLQHKWLHPCIFKYDKNGRINYDIPRIRVKFINSFAKDFILRNCIFRKIRFLHSAEYGSKRGRAHHHCILYGVDFNEYSDVYTKEVFHSGKKQINNYSKTLDKLWPFGEATIGQCNGSSINYVTRYCLKKVLGENKHQYYDGRRPEFITCSTRPALGHQYLIENFKDIASNRNVLSINNKGEIFKVPICRYFSDYIKRVSTQQNNNIAYGSYSDIMYKRYAESNLNKYNKILNAGFFNWSSSKEQKSFNIVKKLKRSYDDSNILDISYIRKLKAFGLDYEYYIKHKSAIDYLFNFFNWSYKQFESPLSSNKLNYVKFEKYRYSMLEFARKRYINVDSFDNISEFEYFKICKYIKSLVNPFKSKKRCKKVLGSAFIKGFVDYHIKLLS